MIRHEESEKAEILREGEKANIWKEYGRGRGREHQSL